MYIPKRFFLALGMLALATGLNVFAQASNASTIIGGDTNVEKSGEVHSAFLLEQRALMEQWTSLIASGASAEQIKAWEQQTAPQFALQRQRLEIMAKASALEPSPTNVQPNIPANASPALKDLLMRQAALANMRAQAHNQQVQSMATTSGASQVNLVPQLAASSSQQGEATDATAEMEDAKTLAAQSAAITLPVPKLPSSVATTSPALANRIELMEIAQQRMLVLKQNINASPAAQAAAMSAWRQQNAQQVQQLQQQAQTSGQTNPSAAN